MALYDWIVLALIAVILALAVSSGVSVRQERRRSEEQEARVAKRYPAR